MANIEKPKFNIFDVSGNNYLSWCLDIELHIQRQGIIETLAEDGKSNEKDEANVLIFVHRHLPDCLKFQYLLVRKPSILWTKLRERYDHTKIVMLHMHNMINNILGYKTSSSCQIIILLFLTSYHDLNYVV